MPSVADCSSGMSAGRTAGPVHASDGHIMCCSIVSCYQSAAISDIAKHFWALCKQHCTKYLTFTFIRSFWTCVWDAFSDSLCYLCILFYFEFYVISVYISSICCQT